MNTQPTESRRRAFAIPAGVCAWILLVACCAQASVLPGWNTNLTAALAQAEKEQQPVLVYFTASWCGPCKLMARTTLTNQTVMDALSGVSHVIVDIDDFPKVAEQHEVRAVPTFQLLSPAGEEVVRLTGLQGADEFVQWLTNGISEVKETVARRRHSDEKLQEVDRLLAAGDTESVRKAAVQLFSLGAERDQNISKAVALRLKSIVRRNPTALLEGLENPRLAVRIQVANVLREQQGESFDVDPWADLEARKKQIIRWRDKLTAESSSQ